MTTEIKSFDPEGENWVPLKVLKPEDPDYFLPNRKRNGKTELIVIGCYADDSETVIKRTTAIYPPGVENLIEADLGGAKFKEVRKLKAGEKYEFRIKTSLGEHLIYAGHKK